MMYHGIQSIELEQNTEPCLKLCLTQAFSNRFTVYCDNGFFTPELIFFLDVASKYHTYNSLPFLKWPVVWTDSRPCLVWRGAGGPTE